MCNSQPLALSNNGYVSEIPMSQKIDTSELVVDFVGGAVGHRFRSGEGRGQALAKAAGLASGITPDIVDATAGLGRDAFLLAALGAKVTLIERSEKMHRLLAEGLARAAAEGGQYAETVARMTLLHGDSCLLIPELKPMVVLVDPMHPPRGNTALVKKEMRQIREIVGTDADSEKLMLVALEHAVNRVVLKWPLRAEPMAGLRKPSHQILGKSTRYDVFVKAKIVAN
jgi:16S rRNA (guanine1516-N2)-methyltransferase